MFRLRLALVGGMQHRVLRLPLPLHHIPPESIEVVGFPQYDRYASTRFLKREEFCKRWGLDPKKKFVVYGALGNVLFEHETLLLDLFERLVKDQKISNTVEFIFRPHPFFPEVLNQMKEFRYVRIDPGYSSSKAQSRGWEFQQSDQEYLVDLLRHTDVFITAGSSLMIEAAIAGKPVINIGFDPIFKSSHPKSPKWFFASYRHVVAFIGQGSTRIVWDAEELADAVNDALTNSQKDAGARQHMLSEFGGYADGKSLERTLLAIQSFVLQVAPPRV